MLLSNEKIFFKFIYLFWPRTKENVSTQTQSLCLCLYLSAYGHITAVPLSRILFICYSLFFLNHLKEAGTEIKGNVQPILCGLTGET